MLGEVTAAAAHHEPRIGAGPPRDRRREVSAGTAVELTVAGADRPLRAHVTSVSSDLEPPLDFAVAEADIVEAVAARDVQIGTLGDVRVVAAK